MTGTTSLLLVGQDTRKTTSMSGMKTPKGKAAPGPSVKLSRKLIMSPPLSEISWEMRARS